MDLLENDDLVLADKGFRIEESLKKKQASLNCPAFRKNGQQISAVNLENSYKISSLRIHVERVIGQLRKKYKILNNTIPISTCSKVHNEKSTLNQIVTVCAALINLNPSIV